MDVLKRLGLVIHWVSFFTGLITAAGFSFVLFVNITESNNSGNIPLFFLIPFSFFSCTGLGWLARFVLAGKCSLLPWKKLDSINKS